MSTEHIEVDGPVLTDHNGELDAPLPSCQGYQDGKTYSCKHLRIHDYHYFFCRELGDKSKPDLDPYKGGLERIWNGPSPPHLDCPFVKAGSFAMTLSNEEA